MSRLAELLADYRQSGEKVVVFSFFHSVLEGIEKSFHTVGRIDGSIASEALDREPGDCAGLPDGTRPAASSSTGSSHATPSTRG